MKPYVFGRSIQGASHIRSGTECQDSYKRVILEDGTAILSVADGHGSKTAPYSKTGSQIAVNVFCGLLKKLYLNNCENANQFLSFLNREGDTSISKAIDDEWKHRILERHRKLKRDIPKLDDGSEDREAVYKQYGSTLLGLLITENYVFAFQLGDGDILFSSADGIVKVIEPERILGVETHSLCRKNSWEKAITVIRRIDLSERIPALFSLSTDGYSNSYSSDSEFHCTIQEYLSMLEEHGVRAVADSLPEWLSETSAMGCGDDITLLVAYYNESCNGNSITQLPNNPTELVADNILNS